MPRNSDFPPFPIRRSIRLFVLAAILLLTEAWAVAQPTELTLKNGAMIEADALQRTGERIVLDLGFTVLTIPIDQIASEGKRGAKGVGPAPAGAATTETAASVPLLRGSKAPVGRKEKETVDEMIDRLEQAVVIVSNPGGLGAGSIIDPAGLVITNYHVVRGEKYHDVTVFLKKPNGRTEKTVFHRVEVLAFSPLLDCALLRIPAKDLDKIELPALPLADPAKVRTGMPAYAIGNPGMGAQILEHSVSQGVLSSTNRNFNDILYLQTTAAVNPGNSGGPLISSEGELIGMVTFRATFQEGLGFALPVWYLRLFLDNARAYAPRGDDKNTGYRYHSPMEDTAKETK